MGKKWARISACANDEKLWGCSLIEGCGNQQGVGCSFDILGRPFGWPNVLDLTKSGLGYLLMMRNGRVAGSFEGREN